MQKYNFYNALAATIRSVNLEDPNEKQWRKRLGCGTSLWYYYQTTKGGFMPFSSGEIEGEVVFWFFIVPRKHKGSIHTFVWVGSTDTIPF